MKNYKIVGVKLPTDEHKEFSMLCEKLNMNQSEVATKMVYSAMSMIKEKKVTIPNFIATVRFSLNYKSKLL